VKLKVACIGRSKNPAINALSAEYLKRISRYIQIELHQVASEAAFFKLAEKSRGRTAPQLILLDSRGRQLTSEEFAAMLREHQDRGTQSLLFAVGPADGFSPGALRQADIVISLGKMTLAHEIAGMVLLEQLYRAFTILKGHPYHIGH